MQSFLFPFFSKKKQALQVASLVRYFELRSGGCKLGGVVWETEGGPIRMQTENGYNSWLLAQNNLCCMWSDYSNLFTIFIITPKRKGEGLCAVIFQARTMNNS